MFIFGAGASSFSGACAPANPPLGNTLFDELVKFGGIAEEFVKEYGAIFRNDGFEAGMAAIQELGSKPLVTIQRQTALYLSQFVIGSDNHYEKLLRRIGNQQIGKCNFASLNYDLLLEQAFDRMGYGIEYSAEATNHHLMPVVQLLKLHGSANFLTTLPENSVFSGNQFFGTQTFVDGLPFSCVPKHQDVVDWAKNERFSDLTPILAVYGKGKVSPYNNSFLKDIQKTWQEKVNQSKLIILIGINYVAHDTHLWDCLSSAPGMIGIVNPDIFTYDGWIKTRNGKTFHLAHKFEETEKIAYAAQMFI